MNKSNYRQRTAIAIAYIMGEDCQVCHYNSSIKSLQCHHLDPSEKEFNISESLRLKKKWHEIENELKKCIQLCVNCHAEYHAGLITIPQESSFSEDRLNEVRTKCKSCDEPIEEIGHEFCSNRCRGLFNWANGNCVSKVDNSTNIIELLIKHNWNMAQAGKEINVSGQTIKNRFVKTTGYKSLEAYQATLANS